MKYFRRAAHLPINLYVTILALLGISLVFIIPPFQVPDEQTHLYRAYQLSNGTLIAKQLSYGVGDMLPRSLSESFDSFFYLLFKPETPLKTDELKQSLAAPLNPTELSETRFENTAPYPPLGYAPQVLAISIGKSFEANPVVLLYMARLANLAVWIAVLWLCMRRQPRIALALFTFALLPIVLFQASSASIDVVTTAAALFFTLEILRLATGKLQLGRKDLAILLAAGIILSLCKLPHVALVLLVFALPSSLFSSLRYQWQFKLMVAVIPLAITTAWTLVSADSFVNLRLEADQTLQQALIIGNPIQYFSVLAATYFALPSDSLYIQMIGHLGWLDTKLTVWSMSLSFASVLLATFAISSTKDYALPPTVLRISAGIIASMIIGAISTILYLTWNVPGASVIEGIQGRYFMPLIGCLMIIFAGVLGLTSFQQRRASIVVYVMLGMTTLATLTAIISRYYGFM